MPSQIQRRLASNTLSAGAIQLLKRIYNSLPLAAQIGLARHVYSTGILGQYFVAFNGQRRRRSVFLDVLKSIDFSYIIETGTFRGSTTQFFAENSAAEIVTIEIDQALYEFARRRLARFSHVKVIHSNSVSYLESALNNDLVNASTLFYLDAHWHDYLPLLDELRLILQHRSNSITFVDDFKTPDDDFYYDDYGYGKVLSLDYLIPLRDREFDIFFPAFPASEETGAKTGFVVLTASRQMSSALSGIRGIKYYGRSSERIQRTNQRRAGGDD